MAFVSKINGYVIKDAEAHSSIKKIVDGDTVVAKAKADESGNVISTTYATNTAVTNAQTAATTAQTAANNAQARADEAFNLASAKGQAHVFETQTEMTSTLKAATNTAYRVGEQLLIKESDVPDYWVTKILSDNTGEYGYYEIAILETEKVDLEGYTTDAEFEALEAEVDSLGLVVTHEEISENEHELTLSLGKGGVTSNNLSNVTRLAAFSDAINSHVISMEEGETAFIATTAYFNHNLEGVYVNGFRNLCGYLPSIEWVRRNTGVYSNGEQLIFIKDHGYEAGPYIKVGYDYTNSQITICPSDLSATNTYTDIIVMKFKN